VRILWYAKAWETYLFWQQNDPTIVGKIKRPHQRHWTQPVQRNWQAGTSQGTAFWMVVAARASPTSIGLSTV
jgi:hypothetical protein